VTLDIRYIILYNIMSRFYYNDVSLATLLTTGNYSPTTNFYEPNGNDMGTLVQTYPNNNITNGATIIAKAIMIYTDLKFNYLSGSSYINVATSCVPRNIEFDVDGTTNNYTDITVPSWCTKIHFMLIGAGGSGNTRGSKYPGGGGEFVYGYVNKPANFSQLHCYVGKAGTWNDNYFEGTNGEDTTLYYSPNTGGATIDLAKAKGGETPSGTSPGVGGSGGFVISGGNALLKAGIVGHSYSINSTIHKKHGMYNTNIEAGTTIDGYNGYQVVYLETQYDTRGIGSNGGDNIGYNGYARLFFTV
jgi:hypothetical protein